MELRIAPNAYRFHWVDGFDCRFCASFKVLGSFQTLLCHFPQVLLKARVTGFVYLSWVKRKGTSSI